MEKREGDLLRSRHDFGGLALEKGAMMRSRKEIIGAVETPVRRTEPGEAQLGRCQMAALEVLLDIRDQQAQLLDCFID